MKKLIRIEEARVLTRYTIDLDEDTLKDIEEYIQWRQVGENPLVVHVTDEDVANAMEYDDDKFDTLSTIVSVADYGKRVNYTIGDLIREWNDTQVVEGKSEELDYNIEDERCFVEGE